MTARRVDLMVLGAGAAGMMSALLAARRGLSVAMIDPHFSQASNLAISGGLFPAAGSHLQRSAGIADSPEGWLADLREFAGASTNERIATAISEALPQLADFLTLDCAAPIRFLADVPAPGHRALRFHSVEPASGRGLHAWLRAAVGADAGIYPVADQPLPNPERTAHGF